MVEFFLLNGPIRLPYFTHQLKMCDDQYFISDLQRCDFLLLNAHAPNGIPVRELDFLSDPFKTDTLTTLVDIRDDKHHVYAKRQTRICST